MEVFFTCPVQGILKNKKYYLRARQIILAQGHELTRDWLPTLIAKAKKKKEKITPLHKFYGPVMKTIIAADAVIVDATVTTIDLGHQINIALDKGKPTLILNRRLSQKQLDGLLINGARSSLLTLRNYKNFKDLEKNIKEFLLKNTRKERVRMNLVLDRKYNDFIEWAAFKYRMSKTDVIKNALRSKLEMDDLYKQYLKGEEA